MSKYSPPFSISNSIIERIASISEKIGRISIKHTLNSKPHLRRVNRIRSIHSSLKIEANSLSLSDVRDVIDGNAVYGDRSEIAEVKNAYSAYELIKDVDPYSIRDLKKLHKIMTADTVMESGIFRSGEEGVFAGDRCIFVAPPPEMVPKLMKDLFEWMKANKDILHPLILSAVFHYEFVFIHPFSDGNGRMARLWHTILLYNWRDVFEYIPLESQIERFQNEYYEAIDRCNKSGNSDVFIEFMLDRIDAILDEVILQSDNTGVEISDYLRRMLDVMELNIPYTAAVIMSALNLKSKETFRKNYMNPAIENGYVIMERPDKPTSKNQRYIRKK